MPIGQSVTARKLDQRIQAVGGRNAVPAGRSTTYQSAKPVSATSDRIVRSRSSLSGKAGRRGVTRYQCPRISAITDVPSATAEAADASPGRNGPSDGLG